MTSSTQLFRNALVPARFLRVLGTFGRPRFSEAANLGISYRHPIWA